MNAHLHPTECKRHMKVIVINLIAIQKSTNYRYVRCLNVIFVSMNIWRIQINFDSINIQWVIFKRLAVKLIFFYISHLSLPKKTFAVKYFLNSTIDGQVFDIFWWAFLEALKRAKKIQFGYTYNELQPYAVSIHFIKLNISQFIQMANNDCSIFISRQAWNESNMTKKTQWRSKAQQLIHFIKQTPFSIGRSQNLIKIFLRRLRCQSRIYKATNVINGLRCGECENQKIISMTYRKQMTLSKWK